MELQDSLKSRRFVIDESVSAAQWLRFQAYAKEHAIHLGETYSVREHHPGMPDRVILHHLLDPTTALLTADRPFHNQALGMGLQSFHIGPDHITCRELPGIHSRPLGPAAHLPAALKADYRPVSPALRSALMPASPTRLNKLTVKRRRIRNHFGGMEQLAQNAITVSLLANVSTTLIGVRLRVSSHGGVKALDASESYIAETTERGHRDHAAFCHALIVPIQLLLHQVRSAVYYDASRMMGPQDQPGGCLGELFQELAACFPQVVFIPVTKGWHLDRMHRKLQDLRTTRTSNEILQGTLQELLHKQWWRTRQPDLIHNP